MHPIAGGEKLSLSQLRLQIGQAGGAESEPFHRSLLSDCPAGFTVIGPGGVDSPQLRREPEPREADDDDEHFHDDRLPCVCNLY